MVAGVLLLTALAVYLLFRLRNLLFMVFVAAFIAVAIEPAVHFLEKRGWRRGLATGLVFLVAFLLGVAFLALLVPLFINQVNDLIDALPGYIETVSLRLNEWFGLEISTESLQEEAARLPNIIIGAGGTILGEWSASPPGSSASSSSSPPWPSLPSTWWRSCPSCRGRSYPR